MKNFYLTVTGILSALGLGVGYNQMDVKISPEGQQTIEFETLLECQAFKRGVIGVFKEKKLTPDQGFVFEAFVDQPCGIVLEPYVPSEADGLTVTEDKVYYSQEEYSDRKNDLYKKSKEDPENITFFEQRELIGIVNEEMKKNGSQRAKSISPHDIVIELEK